MIQVNELRVGNLIEALFNKVIVREIFGTSALVEFPSGKHEVLEYSILKPVPLTTEVLLFQCDFNQYHENPRLESFYVNTQGYYPFHIYTDRAINFYFNENVRIKSLHQLQNLFFANMGEELELKSLP